MLSVGPANRSGKAHRQAVAVAVVTATANARLSALPLLQRQRRSALQQPGRHCSLLKDLIVNGKK